MRLEGKTIIVSGAAHGIGRAYSEKLGSEGASVARLDIDAARNEEVAAGIRAAGGKAIAIRSDVRDFADFRRAVERTAKEFGGVNGIVNNASSTVFRGVPTRAHYVASKSALIGFTRTLARELGAHWIRVNLVCPGSTLSEEQPSEETVAMRE